jgi:hypothetical protein
VHPYGGAYAAHATKAGFRGDVLPGDNEGYRAADGEARGCVTVKALLALSAVLVRISLHQATAARLQDDLPRVPHYDAPLAAPPVTPIGPPNYTKPHDQGESTNNKDATQNKDSKSLWQGFVAIYNGILEGPLTFLTFCLVIANFVLALSTFGLWTVSARSVRVLESIERPYFVLEQLGDFEVRQEQVNRVYLTYSFTNIGRTPAIVGDLKADFFYSPEPPSRSAQYQFHASAVRLHDRAFKPNDGITEELPVLIAGLEFMHRPLCPNIEPGRALYLIMRARYRDVAGRVHETAVCRRYDDLSIFVSYGGAEYNYET